MNMQQAAEGGAIVVHEGRKFGALTMRDMVTIQSVIQAGNAEAEVQFGSVYRFCHSPVGLLTVLQISGAKFDPMFTEEAAESLGNPSALYRLAQPIIKNAYAGLLEEGGAEGNDQSRSTTG